MDPHPDSFETNQPIAIGDVIELEVERLGESGDGLCRVQNYVVWVQGALPGEQVLVEIVAAGRKHGRGELREILRASTERVDPRCRHFGECGGCQLQHLDYRAQLAWKTELVANQLRHALERDEVPVLDCVGPDDPWGHRTRVVLQITEQHGQLAGGLYPKRSRDLVQIDECPISHPAGFKVAQAAIEAARHAGVEAWNPVTDAGALRTVLIRTNSAGQSEATLIMRERDDAGVRAVRDANIGAVGLSVNFNDLDRDRLLGTETEHVAGDRTFSDAVAGQHLRLGPTAWLRTSSFGLEKIVELVGELLDPIPNATILDLYAGVGVFTVTMAGMVHRVIAIEDHPRALADLSASVRANQLKNVDIRRGTVERHLRELRGERPFAAILDPPPEGCGRFVINALAKETRPERLIYISQNAGTFAEDACILEDRGYRLTAVHPVDTTPHTASVELVALFESSLQVGKRRSSIAQARRLLRRVRKGDKES